MSLFVAESFHRVDSGGSSCRQITGDHRHGETFHRTVLALMREHYADFGPTLAAEKLAARHGLRVGVETLRRWMMADGLWKDPIATEVWCRASNESFTPAPE